jgi:hypothetical protein
MDDSIRPSMGRELVDDVELAVCVADEEESHVCFPAHFMSCLRFFQAQMKLTIKQSRSSASESPVE